MLKTIFSLQVTQGTLTYYGSSVFVMCYVHGMEQLLDMWFLELNWLRSLCRSSL